jgi:hypothetical protein
MHPPLLRHKIRLCGRIFCYSCLLFLHAPPEQFALLRADVAPKDREAGALVGSLIDAEQHKNERRQVAQLDAALHAAQSKLLVPGLQIGQQYVEFPAQHLARHAPVAAEKADQVAAVAQRTFHRADHALAISGEAWNSLSVMGTTLAMGIAGTLTLFFGLRTVLGTLAQRQSRKTGLGVFTFRQLQENVIAQPISLAVSSLLILAALCCFGYGVSMTLYYSAQDTHTLDYTFQTSDDPVGVPEKLESAGLVDHFAALFDMRIGHMRADTGRSTALDAPLRPRAVHAHAPPACPRTGSIPPRIRAASGSSAFH